MGVSITIHRDAGADADHTALNDASSLGQGELCMMSN